MQTVQGSLVLQILRVFGLVSLFLTSVPAQAITFKNPPIIPTSTDVAEIATADINNDGKLDLVYVDGTGPQFALHVLLGKGDGTFTHGQDISLPTGVCCALRVADITGDGKADIVLTGFSVASSGQITITVAALVGNGDGTFQTAIQSAFQPTNVSLYPVFRSAFAIGDINGDGKADLALMDRQNEFIYTFLGDNTGKFVPGTTVMSFTRDAVYLLDLNGDGILDILTTDAIGAQFKVFLGKGDGTFPTFATYSAGTAAGPFFLADVNGDGHPDILAPFFQANSPTQIGYFKGNPDGTFSSLINIGASPCQCSPLVSASDLNLDGKLDLIFLTPSGMAVSLGQSGPSFGPILTTISGGSMSPYTTLPTTPVLGDFNGDGKTDVAMAVEGGIVLLFGKGDGTFASADFYDMGQPVGSAAVAKFSSSGNMDIAVSLSAPLPRLLLGDGKGNFTLGPDPNSSYGTQTPVFTTLAADFNGDGKPDLNLGNMLPNTPSSVTQSVTFNLGNNAFSAPVAVSNSSPIMADFNRDGRMDIINVSGMQIVASLGQSNNGFVPVITTLHLGFDTGLFNVGDVNNDGKPDLVINYRDHLEIWLGNGDGTFTYSSSIDLQNQNIVSAAIAAVADVDGDGNADILLSPESSPAAGASPLAVFYGNGNGTFLPPVFIPIAHGYSQIVVADVNRDNLPDLVMTDGAAIAVIMNLGGRTFDSEVDYIAGRSISGLNVVDVNSDGFPDIVVANGDGYYGVQGPNFSGTTVTVLLNQPSGTSPNGAPVSGILSVAPEPSVGTQPFTMTLTVSSQTSGGVTPTGSVGFSLDGQLLADVLLANGAASYTFSGNLIPVQHAVTAAYSGDGTYASKIFSVSHTVQPPTYATQTTLTATPLVVLASQTVRFVAQVTSVVPIPSGVITFLDGSASLGSASINASGTAYFDTALLRPGVHSVSAKFEGLTEYGFGSTSLYVAAVFSSSTSAATTVNVNANATSVSLAASPGTPTAGTVVNLTAQVTSNAGVPFGGVSFYDGSSLLGTLSLDANGSATFSTASLTTGSHSITASFNANGPFAGSISPPLGFLVTAPPAAAIPTFVSLAPQFNPGSGVSLLATVSAPNFGPGGMVTFLDSGIILGTAPVNSSGVALLQLAGINSGTHALTASFSGSSPLAPSVSLALNEQWPQSGPGFFLRVAIQPYSVIAGAEAFLKVSVVPIQNSNQAIELSCANGLPEGYICTFSPAVLLGSGDSSLRIARGATSAHSKLPPGSWPGIAIASVSLVLLGSLKSSRSGFALLIAVVLLFGLIAGCGESRQSAQVVQTSVITIQASGGSGTAEILHSTQVPVQLQVVK